MPNALGNIDNGHLPSKCPIHSRNPPSPFFRDPAARREDPSNPRHPRSISLKPNSPTVSEARKKLEYKSQEVPEQSECEKTVDSTAKIW